MGPTTSRRGTLAVQAGQLRAAVKEAGDAVTHRVTHNKKVPGL